MKKIHILGVCGTFMGGLAQLAKSMGYQVSGQDQAVYPPMSTQLERAGITMIKGFSSCDIPSGVDEVIIGNALSRGNEAVEAVLNQGIRYTSGPAWLAEHLLQGQHVLAVAGTHGKTTTSSMLAWILTHAGLNPGFLIGGVAPDLAVSARLGDQYFVIEADEYDSAFFDKRAKFIHYRPQTLVLNNLEFDHADIYSSLDDIKRQFHHLVRTVPGQGHIIWPQDEQHLQHVVSMGLWSQSVVLGAHCEWEARATARDCHAFDVFYKQEKIASVETLCLGEHNMKNALSAFVAAYTVGVPVDKIAAALECFQGVKRRLEVYAVERGVTIYDDFAHHPTAIETTLNTLRVKVGQKGRIFAVFEPRSNTMKQGCHNAQLAAAFDAVDHVFSYQSEQLSWSLEDVLGRDTSSLTVMNKIDALVNSIVTMARPGDHVVVMSNGSFGGIHEQLKNALKGISSVATENA